MRLHTHNMDALRAEESLLAAQRFAVGSGRLEATEHDEIQGGWIRAARAPLPKTKPAPVDDKKALARLRLMGFEVEERG